MPTMTGAELRQLRRMLGLTQVKLGEAIGLTGEYIAHLEAGRAPITERTARQLLALPHPRRRPSRPQAEEAS